MQLLRELYEAAVGVGTDIIRCCSGQCARKSGSATSLCMLRCARHFIGTFGRPDGKWGGGSLQPPIGEMGPSFGFTTLPTHNPQSERSLAALASSTGCAPAVPRTRSRRYGRRRCFGMSSSCAATAMQHGRWCCAWSITSR